MSLSRQIKTANRTRSRKAFTLIELLVVISIIALLISILLPSLQTARAQAKAVVCASHIRHVGQAMASYLCDFDGVYPASYYYPDENGNIAPENQTRLHPYGYWHWSHFLYNSGRVEAESFECPSYENGGAPRTNPGPDAKNWEGGQVDQEGDSHPNNLEDKQAPRMAFAVNAAIVPRNKFTPELSGGQRVNVQVRDVQLTNPSSTILATEYLNNWKALGIQEGGGILSKSHRPINPYYHVGSGYDEYTAPPQSPGFIYGLPNDQDTYGLLSYKEVQQKVNILDHTSGLAQINAIGRSHPGGKQPYGGTANFVYCDGHVERMTALDSVKNRQWGDRYWSISGENKVMNMAPID